MLMRAAAADGRVGPFENLHLNPRYVRAQAGANIVRRNLVPSPRAATGLVGGNAIAQVASGAPDGGSFARSTFTSARALTPGNDVLLFGRTEWSGQGIGSITVQPGRTYTASLYLRASVALRLRLQPQPIIGNTGGALMVSATLPNLDAPADTWVRLWTTFTVPISGTPAVRLDVDAASDLASQTIPAGATIDVTMIMLEERPALLPYFDGATVDSTGIAYAWEGAAGASTAIARATTIEVCRNYWPDPWGANVGRYNYWPGSTPGTSSRTIENVTWSKSGKAVRVTWAGSSSTETPGVILGNLGLTVGATYTLEWDIRVSATIGSLSPSLVGGNAAGWSMPAVSPSVNPAAGTTIHQWATFVVGTGTDVRIASTWLGRPDGWAEISNLTIYAGTRNAALAYFDGDITPEANLGPSWTGTPGASASVLAGIRPARIDYTNGSLNGVGGMSFPCRWVDPDDTTYVRFQNYGAPGTWRVMLLAPGAFTRFAGGDDVTVLIRCRRPVAGDTGSTQFMLATGGATSSSVWYNLPISTEWVWARFVIRVTQTTFGGTGIYYSGGSTQSRPLDVSHLTIVPGRYDGPHLDGDVPGAVWRSTPHDSATVGYPAAA